MCARVCVRESICRCQSLNKIPKTSQETGFHPSSFGYKSVEARLDAGSLEVVCIGYDLFTSNRDSLAKFEWLLVVFDEMHVLKNPKSQRWCCWCHFTIEDHFERTQRNRNIACVRPEKDLYTESTLRPRPDVL